MKTSIPFLFVSLLLSFSSVAVSAGDDIEKHEPPKYKNLFMFKAEKQFLGAQVEVYNANGNLITSQSLQKRKMVIDFEGAKFGAYTIRIVKGQALQEFKYVKK